MPRTKQDIIDDIYLVLGKKPPKVSRGSTEPKSVFVDVGDRVRLSLPTSLSKPGMGEALARAAALPWGRDCDSRHTRSGGGSTVTAVGLERVLQSLMLITGSTAGPRPATTAAEPREYINRAGRRQGMGNRAPVLMDLNALDEATEEHKQLQDDVASAVRRAGLKPLRPEPADPQFDVAWRRGASLVVCEVKTWTGGSRQQIRLGLGQVAEYRQVYVDRGEKGVTAVLVTSERADALADRVASFIGIRLACRGTIAEDLRDLL